MNTLEIKLKNFLHKIPISFELKEKLLVKIDGVFNSERNDEDIYVRTLLGFIREEGKIKAFTGKKDDAIEVLNLFLYAKEIFDIKLYLNTNFINRYYDFISILSEQLSLNIVEELITEYTNEKKLTDFFATLIQELVLRGKFCSESKVICTYWKFLSESGHPLSVLPLTLFDEEKNVNKFLPRYYENGVGWSSDYGPGVVKEESFEYKIEHNKPKKKYANIHPFYINNLLHDWEYEYKTMYFSDGCYDIIDFFNHSDLLCFKDDGVSISYKEVGFKGVFELFFSLGSLGGPYDSYNGAYGRLKAWQGISDLVYNGRK